jgi:threonine synthase
LGKGFLEMQRLGFISKLPKISIIQAEGANPLYRWFNDENRRMLPVTAETRATAIRIGNPASWRKAATIIERMGGWCEQVSEQEIALAKAEIGAEGIGCEPASAVTFAGLKKLVKLGVVGKEERTVLILTGHTLKDSEYTINYHRGELLTAAESAQATLEESRLHTALRKPPMVMEANLDVVLRALEAEMKLGQPA